MDFWIDSSYACLPGNLFSFFFFYIEIFYTVCFLKAGYTCKSCPFICCTGIGLFFNKTQFEALEKSVSYIILFVRCQIVFWWLLLSFRWPVYELVRWAYIAQNWTTFVPLLFSVDLVNPFYSCFACVCVLELLTGNIT